MKKVTSSFKVAVVLNDLDIPAIVVLAGAVDGNSILVGIGTLSVGEVAKSCRPRICADK